MLSIENTYKLVSPEATFDPRIITFTWHAFFFLKLGLTLSMLIGDSPFHTITPGSSQVKLQSATVAPLSRLIELLINCLAQGKHIVGKNKQIHV